MEVKIGVKGAARELSLESALSSEEIAVADGNALRTRLRLVFSFR